MPSSSSIESEPDISIWEAEEEMRRALAIEEQSYGPDHHKVAVALSNLAQLLRVTNRMEEAEQMMKRALEINEQSYGPSHPKVATDLNDLAILLEVPDRMVEAEAMLRRALAIDEQSYDASHSNVARDLHNLATLLQNTNRLEEGEPMMKRSVIILLQFSARTGEQPPYLNHMMRNYSALCLKCKVPEDGITARLLAMGRDAEMQDEVMKKWLKDLWVEKQTGWVWLDRILSGAGNGRGVFGWIGKWFRPRK